MVKRSCGDLYVISGKWLGVFWNYFENQGLSQNFRGLQLNYKETEGLFANFLE
jgi:hypothetical protein